MRDLNPIEQMLHDRGLRLSTAIEVARAAVEASRYPRMGARVLCYHGYRIYECTPERCRELRSPEAIALHMSRTARPPQTASEKEEFMPF